MLFILTRKCIRHSVKGDSSGGQTKFLGVRTGIFDEYPKHLRRRGVGLGTRTKKRFLVMIGKDRVLLNSTYEAPELGNV